jgi:hypothetical protein
MGPVVFREHPFMLGVNGPPMAAAAALIGGQECCCILVSDAEER